MSHSYPLSLGDTPFISACMTTDSKIVKVMLKYAESFKIDILDKNDEGKMGIEVANTDAWPKTLMTKWIKLHRKLKSKQI